MSKATVQEPIATNLLILGTLLASLAAFNRPDREEQYCFRPEDILARKEYYRVVTCAFLHGGWAHLLVNMYGLYVFGGALERLYGPAYFLIIYFGSIAGGSLLSLYMHRHHDYKAYGASGGVCGVLFAWLLAFPYARLMLFPLPYAVPGWLYGMAFMAASLYAMHTASDNIGHDAHLGGAMLGLLLAAFLHPEAARRHWLVLAGLLLMAGVILAYLGRNPLLLPLRAVFDRAERPRRAARTTAPARSREEVRPPPAEAKRRFSPADLEVDWLIQEIEAHVGLLRPDPSGRHDWLDKFDRTYDVLGGSAEHFNLQTFTTALRDHLAAPGLHFVIVDTRELHDDQVAQLRPLLADLPEAQFKRVIRSYGFDSRQSR